MSVLGEVPGEPTLVPPPALGIDLDGTIDEAPSFFRVLTDVWPGKVYVITWRRDRRKAEADLRVLGIRRFDEIVLVNGFAEKAVVCERLGITVMFDDADEVLQHLPPGVVAMKVRNGGNFDFDGKRFLYTSRTGRAI